MLGAHVVKRSSREEQDQPRHADDGPNFDLHNAQYLGIVEVYEYCVCTYIKKLKFCGLNYVCTLYRYVRYSLT